MGWTQLAASKPLELASRSISLKCSSPRESLWKAPSFISKVKTCYKCHGIFVTSAAEVIIYIHIYLHHVSSCICIILIHLNCTDVESTLPVKSPHFSSTWGQPLSTFRVTFLLPHLPTVCTDVAFPRRGPFQLQSRCLSHSFKSRHLKGHVSCHMFTWKMARVHSL